MKCFKIVFPYLCTFFLFTNLVSFERRALGDTPVANWNPVPVGDLKGLLAFCGKGSFVEIDLIEKMYRETLNPPTQFCESSGELETSFRSLPPYRKEFVKFHLDDLRLFRSWDDLVFHTFQERVRTCAELDPWDWEYSTCEKVIPAIRAALKAKK